VGKGKDPIAGQTSRNGEVGDDIKVVKNRYAEGVGERLTRREAIQRKKLMEKGRISHH